MPTYQRGAGCGKGRHSWENHGSYLKCTTCSASQRVPGGATIPRTKRTESSGGSGCTTCGRGSVNIGTPDEPVLVHRFGDAWTGRPHAYKPKGRQPAVKVVDRRMHANDLDPQAASE